MEQDYMYKIKNIFFISILNKSVEEIGANLILKNHITQFNFLISFFEKISKFDEILYHITQIYDCFDNRIDKYNDLILEILYLDYKILLYLIRYSLLFCYIYCNCNWKNEIDFVEFIDGIFSFKKMNDYFVEKYFVDTFENESTSSISTESGIQSVGSFNSIQELEFRVDSPIYDEILSPYSKYTLYTDCEKKENQYCPICCEENKCCIICLNHHILCCVECVLNLKNNRCPFCNKIY